jgi:hypothetical protein
MFEWLQDLIDAITGAINASFENVGQTITMTIWNTMLTWMYDCVFGAVAEFFTIMGNMGAEIFDLPWIQATVRLFTLFGWGLFVAGVVVAVFDLANTEIETVSGTETAAPSDDGNSDTDDGANVGAIVGISLAVLGTGGGLAAFFLIRKKKKERI